MGIFDSIARGFGSLRSLSDAELEGEREALRLRYVGCGDIAQASRLYDELHRYDDEMTRRSDGGHKREGTGSTTRRREHGWYLPNDD
jgi:hypothetical protein